MSSYKEFWTAVDVIITLVKKKFLFKLRGYDILIEAKTHEEGLFFSHIFTKEGESTSVRRYDGGGFFDVSVYSCQDGDKIEFISKSTMRAKVDGGKECTGGAVLTFGQLCFENIDQYSKVWDE